MTCRYVICHMPILGKYIKNAFCCLPGILIRIAFLKKKQHRYGCHEWNLDCPFYTNRIHISKWKAGFNSIFWILASSVTWLLLYNVKYHSNKIIRIQVIKIQKWFIKMTLSKNSSISYSNLFTLVKGSHTLLHWGAHSLAQGTVQVKLAGVFKNGHLLHVPHFGTSVQML